MEIDPKYNLVDSSRIQELWKEYQMAQQGQYITFNDYLKFKLGF